MGLPQIQVQNAGSGVKEFWGRTIGKKIVMAMTGFILYSFVILHMLGNLKTFKGPQSINSYGIYLREMAAPFFARSQALWIVRVILLVSAALHITSAFLLTALDWRCRPVRYRKYRYVAVERGTGTYASRTMRWGGTIIGLFVIYHLLDQTTGTLHPDYVRSDVFHNLTTDFKRRYRTGIYAGTMAVLGLHLHHGMWSLVHTVGWDKSRSANRVWRSLALASALFITVGFISVPAAIFSGWLRENKRRIQPKR